MEFYMKIAIPVLDGVLSPHFGQCQHFAVIELDPETKTVIKQEMMTPHEPGSYPAWLAGLGCNLIIAGGMGGRAVNLFEQNGINVIMGASCVEPDKIINSYLNNELQSGNNMCGEPGFKGRESCSD